MSVRVAAIGVNHWHSLYDMAYLPQLQKMPGVEIVGIHDDDNGVATHRVEALGGGIPMFTRYPAMLSETRPDLVLVLDRHDKMAAIAEDLLDRPMPFIIEKPAGFNAEQLRQSVDKADAPDRFAAVPFQQRYSPLIEHARRLLDDGSLGPMRHFYSRLNRPTSARYPPWGSGWMLDPEFSNGGCLRNLGGHGLDCFVYLTGEGEDIGVTGAQLSWSTHGQAVEDYATVMLSTGRGVLGTIEVGNVFPSDGRDGEMKVDFQEGILKLEGSAVRLYTKSGCQTLPVLPDPPSILEKIVGALIDGDRPPVGIRDCYLAVRLIDEAYVAAGNPYGTASV